MTDPSNPDSLDMEAIRDGVYSDLSTALDVGDDADAVEFKNIWTAQIMRHFEAEVARLRTVEADRDRLAAALADAQAETERLHVALNRRNEPPASEYLTKLHDRAHKQPMSRVWRTVDYLVHQLDRSELDLSAARAFVAELQAQAANEIKHAEAAAVAAGEADDGAWLAGAEARRFAWEEVGRLAAAASVGVRDQAEQQP